LSKRGANSVGSRETQLAAAFLDSAESGGSCDQSFRTGWRMNKKTWIQLTLGLIVSGVFLTYSLSYADLPRLGRTLTTINWLYAVPFLLITLATMWVRTVRWKVLLTPACNLPAKELWSPLNIGFAINGIFPARAGEFARAWLVARKAKVKFSSVFATVVVERIYDMILLLLVIIAVFSLQDFSEVPPQKYGGVEIDAPMLSSLSKKLAVVFGIMLLGALATMFHRTRAIMESILRKMPLPHNLRDKLLAILHAFGQGFESLGSWKLIAGAFFSTVLLWIMVGWSLSVMAMGFEGMDKLGTYEGIAITMLVCLAIMIPAAPGYWGLYEVGSTLAIQLLNVTQDYELALGYSLTVHALQVILTVGLGLGLAVKERLKPSELASHASDPIDDQPATA